MTEDQRTTVEALIVELTHGTGLNLVRYEGVGLFHVEDRDAMFFRLGIIASKASGLSLARDEIDGVTLFGPPEALIATVTAKVLATRREYAKRLREAADRMDPK